MACDVGVRLHSAGLIRMGRLRGNGGLGPGCYDTIGGWEPRGRGLLLLYYNPPDGSSVWGLTAAGGSLVAASRSERRSLFVTIA